MYMQGGTVVSSIKCFWYACYCRRTVVFDITWTLYEVLSRKLGNRIWAHGFLVWLKFGIVKQLTGWTCGINCGQNITNVVELKYPQQCSLISLIKDLTTASLVWVLFFFFFFLASCELRVNSWAQKKELLLWYSF